MKNLTCFIILMFSSILYSQNGDIENDNLFLKYEEKFLNFTKSDYGRKYEEEHKHFYEKFNMKVRKSFEKSRDKERWIRKNALKISFNSENEAITAYHKYLTAKENLDNSRKKIQEIRQELLQKYDESLIWETLQSRLKK